MSFNPIPWEILNLYFKENSSFLVNHHLESYNEFFDSGISQLLREKNPIHFFKNQQKIIIDKETRFVNFILPNGEETPLTKDELEERFPDEDGVKRNQRWEKAKGKGPIKTLILEEYRYQARLYIGGKDGTKIYYGKPIIYDKNKENKIMYPNEARLRNLTYAFTMHYDVDVEFTLYLPVGDGSGKFRMVEHEITLNKLYFGKFPIMLRSNLCILNGMAENVRKNMGEDSTDPGGYFIIDGKEKVIISQEKFADNMLYIQKDPNDLISYSAKIRSVSEDASKPVRTLAIKMIKETPSSSNGNIVISIPNVRKPVPLFIVMRALGVISDREIVEYCLLDINKYPHYLPTLRPSVHDAGVVFTQQAALKFIATLTKGKTTSHALQILMIYFLPHIGELNFKQKALYIGYAVKRLLQIAHGEDKPTDRDSYLYKRLEIPGTLIYDLFREYYTAQQKNIFLKMDEEYFYAVKKSAKSYQDGDFMNLIVENQSMIFNKRLVESGFSKAFKGDWGSEAHTKKPGVLQDLSRLSYFSTMAQMRKTNTPIAADGAKIVGPRHINSTQWGILCPIHSPDGGNVGLHKHLAIMTHVTKRLSGYPFIEFLRQSGFNMQLLEECTLKYLSNVTKIFVNGAWIGVTSSPEEMKNKLLLHRRNGLFNIFTSIRWNEQRNEIHIQTDAGRPCHPLFHVKGDKISYENKNIIKKITNKNISWNECVLGIGKSSEERKINNNQILSPSIFTQKTNLNETEAIVEYLDTQEMEGVMLASTSQNRDTYINKKITHIEIDSSVILSMMANQIIFPATNPYPRNAFSCGQSKQAVSMFHTNFQNRMDKSALLLNYGQNPIVRSRYYGPVTGNKHPYGINAIVAIACYTGYNVEDAVIMNRAALDRGLFRTTYFNVYEATEEETNVGSSEIRSEFMDIEKHDVIGLKPGYDYSHLDPNSGLIKENTAVDDKTIIIGKAVNSLTSGEIFVDESIACKKGQLGHVDKAFITETEGGLRLAKIRIRHDRIPAIGDKFCSRAGQKGTIGIVLNEQDMPFTKEGLRPDIIVNPHALPSRMTVGHLVEVLIGKACVLTGSLGDSTAFINKGPKNEEFGNVLIREGFSSTGNELMYNGMTGEQLETEIYFGPTYYLRLKHMVKDKINYRARGPRTVLTRQTVQGRSNNGGLRIGEMDRDAIISHGLASFLQESMMERGDKYFMAICNNTGTIAVYNESRNIFLSPMADGPIKFIENLEGGLNIVPLTRFGRDFSIVKVPYAFKLLYQELQAMNIQMRIITEDNVEQLTSMKNSDNVVKLTGLKNLEDVANKAKKRLEKDNALYKDIQQNRKILETEEADREEDFFDSQSGYDLGTPFTTPWQTNEGEFDQPPFGMPINTSMQQGMSPIYQPGSPTYSNNSPGYQPISPIYGPIDSPPFQPISPTYGPTDSPPYQPISPTYDPRVPPPPKSPPPELNLPPSIMTKERSTTPESDNNEEEDDGETDDEMKKGSLEKEESGKGEGNKVPDSSPGEKPKRIVITKNFQEGLDLLKVDEDDKFEKNSDDEKEGGETHSITISKN